MRFRVRRGKGAKHVRESEVEAEVEAEGRGILSPWDRTQTKSDGTLRQKCRKRKEVKVESRRPLYVLKVEQKCCDLSPVYVTPTPLLSCLNYARCSAACSLSIQAPLVVVNVYANAAARTCTETSKIGISAIYHREVLPQICGLAIFIHLHLSFQVHCLANGNRPEGHHIANPSYICIAKAAPVETKRLVVVDTPHHDATFQPGTAKEG